MSVYSAWIETCTEGQCFLKISHWLPASSPCIHPFIYLTKKCKMKEMPILIQVNIKHIWELQRYKKKEKKNYLRLHQQFCVVKDDCTSEVICETPALRLRQYRDTHCSIKLQHLHWWLRQVLWLNINSTVKLSAAVKLRHTYKTPTIRLLFSIISVKAHWSEISFYSIIVSFLTQLWE